MILLPTNGTTLALIIGVLVLRTPQSPDGPTELQIWVRSVLRDTAHIGSHGYEWTR